MPVKTVTQQELTALHRLRGPPGGPDARNNTCAACCASRASRSLPEAARRLPGLALTRDANSGLGDCASSRASARHEIRELERRIDEMKLGSRRSASQTPLVVRLRSVPGVGLLTATALAGFVGDLRRFPSGRHFASYLGLTPREHSTGATRRLGSISKRGDVYLRMLLIHGARAVLCHGGAAARARPAAALGARCERTARPQQGDRRTGQQAGPHRLGRVRLTRALRDESESSLRREVSDSVDCDATRRTDDDSVETDAGIEPITILAFEAGAATGSPRADFILARSPARSNERPQIRLQSVLRTHTVSRCSHAPQERHELTTTLFP